MRRAEEGLLLVMLGLGAFVVGAGRALATSGCQDGQMIKNLPPASGFSMTCWGGDCYSADPCEIMVTAMQSGTITSCVCFGGGLAPYTPYPGSSLCAAHMTTIGSEYSLFCNTVNCVTTCEGNFATDGQGHITARWCECPN